MATRYMRLCREVDQNLIMGAIRQYISINGNTRHIRRETAAYYGLTSLSRLNDAELLRVMIYDSDLERNWARSEEAEMQRPD